MSKVTPNLDAPTPTFTPLGGRAHTHTHQEVKNKYATWQAVKDGNKTWDEVYRKGGK